jgi:hypothetical protein
MSTPHRHLGFVRAAACATACLLAACGDGGDALETFATAPDDASAHAVVLDMEVLSSLEAAARHAAREHGAPVEGERAVYLVRSCRPEAATLLAKDLAQRGFDPVVPVGVPCR